jgi:hypothetical protein
VAPHRFAASDLGLEIEDLEPLHAVLAREAALDTDDDAVPESAGAEFTELGAGLSGEVRLVLAVVAHAARDCLAAGNRASAWRWLESPLAELALDAAGIDAEALRSRLRARARRLQIDTARELEPRQAPRGARRVGVEPASSSD